MVKSNVEFQDGKTSKTVMRHENNIVWTYECINAAGC